MEISEPVCLSRRAGVFPVAALLAIGALCLGSMVEAQSLRVSGSSMDLQNQQASRHGYTFARTPEEVIELVAAGKLIPISSSDDFVLKEDLSFPFARLEVVDFLDRLGEGYREACGEQLVVTSLTRPKTRQPRHASKRSVHPTGMAMDLRRSWNRNCRGWLEVRLLSLEANGVLDAMVEWNPPHYHVALFPNQYRNRGMGILASGEATHYEVSRGDTLWKIAKRHNTDVYSVKAINDLRSNQIYIGQVLKLPAGSR